MAWSTDNSPIGLASRVFDAPHGRKLHENTKLAALTFQVFEECLDPGNCSGPENRSLDAYLSKGRQPALPGAAPRFRGTQCHPEAARKAQTLPA